MNWLLIEILGSIMLFSYWLVYIMGSPLADKADDIDERAILFSFPLWLAKRRLTPEYLKDMKSRYYQEMNLASDYVVKIGLKRDLNKNILLKGRELFTWERSLLCPICLHWWATLIFGIISLSFDLFHAREDFFIAGFVYLVLHLIIRKIA